MPARTHRNNRLRSRGGFRAPVAFAGREDDALVLTLNPNAGKRHAAPFDRDSATAKRGGDPTQGAKLARQSPLGSRGKRYGSTRIPSLPLATSQDGR